MSLLVDHAAPELGPQRIGLAAEAPWAAPDDDVRSALLRLAAQLGSASDWGSRTPTGHLSRGAGP